VSLTLGKEFVSNEASSLEDVCKDTDYTTPMIFVLSPGSDPLANLTRFAKEKDKKMAAISLGQGQEPIAEKAINDAKNSGEWVVLQNCHLSRTFMPMLENIIEKFSEAELVEIVDDETKAHGAANIMKSLDIKNVIHPDFRLFLTSSPCDFFPITVLQNSVKLTNEPPKGIKANLMKNYTDYADGIIENCKQVEVWRNILYSLTLFHSVVLERRKFGSLGWNKTYDFNDSD